MVNSLSLKERYNAFKENNITCEFNESNYETWTSRKSLLTKDHFTKILTNNNFNIKIYSNVISPEFDNNTNEILQKYLEKTEYYKIYQECMGLLSNNDDLYFKEMSFSYLVRPFLDRIKIFLLEFINDKNFNKLKIDDKKLFKGLISQINLRLVGVCIKVFILELNEAREKELLIGDDSTDRFHFFVEWMGGKENLTNLYKKYESMAKILSIITFDYMEFVREILNNINNDYDELTKFFELPKDSILENVEFGAGDTHHNGRTTCYINFSSGLKILYKDRNLEVAMTYYKIIEFINNNLPQDMLDLKVYKVLPKKNYSYEEFIEHVECEDKTIIANYFRRFGQLLGVSYFLNGTDFHKENLIASGKYPIIIDLETLIQNDIGNEIKSNTLKKISENIRKSVVSTALIPTNVFGVDKNKILDFSAINVQEQITPFEVLVPVNIEKDNMKLVYKQIKVENSKNIPMYQGQSISYSDYKDEIILGFKMMCDFFVNNKTFFLNELYPLFSGNVIRILIRNTQTYFKVLQESTHPDFMKNFLEKDKLFENLWTIRIKDTKIVESEYASLCKHDIPFFYSKTDSTSIYDADGKEYRNFFEIPSYQLLIDKLNKFKDKDLREQIDLLNITLCSNNNVDKFFTSSELNLNVNTKYDLIEEAVKIEQEIRDRLYYDENKNEFVFLEYCIEKNNLKTMSYDLYSGTSGLILFYFYLYEQTKNIDYYNMYIKIYDSCKKITMIYLKNEERKNENLSDSCISGIYSLLYPAIKIYEKTGKYAIKNDINTIFNHIDEKIQSFIEYDWVNGLSSILHLTINMYESTNDIEYLQRILKYKEKLENILDINEKKVGYAHGVSSLIYIFARINNIFPDKNNIIYIKEFLKFEDDNFIRNQGWALDDKGLRNNSWCNGNIGVIVARAKAIKYIDDQELIDILEESIQRISENDIVKIYDLDILCHGNIGITEFYIQKYLCSNNKLYLDKAQIVAMSIIERANYNNQYITNNLSYYHNLGLFTGLAGIGYQLLRLNDLNSVPSLLYLQ